MQGTLPAGFCKISTLFCRLQWQGSFFLEVPAKGAFCFAVRGGKRQFSLAETCQPVHFWTPRFLAAQRGAVSSRREEIAQRKLLKGFPLDSFPNRGAAPLWHPAPPGTSMLRIERACVLLSTL